MKYADLPPEEKARRNKWQRDWRKRNPEKTREINRRLHEKKKSGYYKEKTKRSERKALLKERLAGRPRPLVCEVCASPGKIVWDHCHTKGVFRGWLCEPCNKALGFVRDSPERLRQLATYLEQGGVGAPARPSD